MSLRAWRTSNTEDEEIVSGWEDALTEVEEQEESHSDHAERRISLTEEDDGLAEIAELSKSISDGPGDHGGPPLIIQSRTVDSAPLIQLESSESDKNDDEEEDKNNQDGKVWLDLADSSSSKGSQGSYADQVPALSGSGSMNDPFDVVDFESQRKERTILQPQQDRSVSSVPQNIDTTIAEAPSLSEVPTDEGKSPSKHTTESFRSFLSASPVPRVDAIDSVDDILGPNKKSKTLPIVKNESVDDILGPKTPGTKLENNTTMESMDYILGPRNKVGSPYESILSSPPKQETLGQFQTQSPPNTQTRGPAENPPRPPQIAPPPPELQTMAQDHIVNSIVQSLGEHQRSPHRPGRVFIGPKESEVSQSSTFESRSSYATSTSDGNSTELSKPESSWTDSRHPLSPGYSARNGSTSLATSSYSQSRDGTLSADASSYSTHDSRRRPPTPAFSPHSQNDSIFSSDTHTVSDGDTNTLSCEGSMNADGSVLSGGTGTTSYTGYSNRSPYTQGTGTDGSFTERTRSTYIVSPAAQSAAGSNTTDFFSANDRSGTSHSRTKGANSMQDEAKERSFSKHSSLFGSFMNSPSAHSKLGEPTRSPRATERSPRHAASPSDRNPSQFAQSLMARTRSRAETSAVVPTASSGALGDGIASRPTMVRIGEELDEQFIVNMTLARKRVSVVQLLVVGLLSLLVCFFGGIWIQSSCHYVSANVRVGASNEVFNLHYGLWRYSPMGSAFQGYTYCDKYDESYTVSPPRLSRIASFLASLGGTYAVCVLWVYLIFGRGTRLYWNAAVRAAFVAGLLHGASLLIFISPICYEKDCELGPAGFLSLLAVAANFVLSFEMYYNSPIKSWMDDVPSCPSNEEPRRMMQTLQVSDFREGASAYWRRLTSAPSVELPTLNQIQRQNDEPIGESLVGRGHSPGVYSPPAIV